MRRVTALLASFVLLLTLVPAAALAAPSATGTWIVTLRDGVRSATAAHGLARQHGGEVGYVYTHALNGFSFRGSQTAANALMRNPNVALVEADAEVWLDATQSPATWGLDRIDQPNLPLSNSYTYDADGTGVTAYVIDSGIRTTHSEFATATGSRARLGANFVDDGNGTTDCNGHGTHVAGTIGGKTYGVAKNVSLVSVRVFGCSGGSTWEIIIAGIEWVTANAVKPAVANLSLGGSSNSSVDSATRKMINANVATAVAAGNGNFIGRQADACNYSPARVAEAMTVSATNSSDQKASWANYGSCVDWFAPGVSITSAWYESNTATNTISGTSMASPHTAGVAAQVLQANPGWSAQAVRDAIYNKTTKNRVSSSSTTNNHLLFSDFPAGSGGSEPPTDDPPAAPTGLTATAGDGSVTLNWAANGEQDLAGYNVYRSTTSSGTQTKLNGTALEDSSYVDALVTNGFTYYYVVTAVDNGGNESGPSNQVAVTPSGGGGSGDASVIHVSDLDGSPQSNGSTWTAAVTVTVRDGTGALVSGVVVTGDWSNGATGSGMCTTNDGVCTFFKSSILKRTSSVTFSVTHLSKSGLTYDSTANADPDGGSDGTTIIVLKS